MKIPIPADMEYDNSKHTWNACRIEARGDVQSVSFATGEERSPRFNFVFIWDSIAHDVRVNVYTDSFGWDVAIWTSCPPPDWKEATESICQAFSMRIVREVMAS
jgi:hypothetical protein